MSTPQADALGTLVRFAHELRREGLALGVGQVEACARAFEWLDPLSPADVYHAARATLVTRYEDLRVFDAVFKRFWLAEPRAVAGVPAPRAPRHDAGAARQALAVMLAERAQPGDPERNVEQRTAASASEVLSAKDFSQLSPAELAALEQSLVAERWQLALRRTRRRVAHRRGKELDFRRLTARAARTGGAVLELARRRPKLKQRPLVVLADISASMELYTRILLYFMHSMKQALRQSLAEVETFVFATRLTRISSELEPRKVEHALAQVSASVLDFQSGTRIGESLRTFNTRWSRRVLRRGAVVLLVSDGWECGDIEVLQREMRFLRDRCYRLIWLNPRLGEREYEPRVAGMSAALPFVDDFLSAHNLQSLRELAGHLARLPRRRGSRGGARPATAPAARNPEVS